MADQYGNFTQGDWTAVPGLLGGNAYYVTKTNADGSVGYDFFDASGAPIDSAQFAAITGTQGPASVGNTQAEAPLAPSAPVQTGRSAQEIANLNQEHNKNLRDIEQAYQNGLLTWQERMDSLEQARSSLTTNKDTGLQNNSAYFSSVSPDAFQSQMGNYNQKVLDAYTQGQNTIANDQASINNYKQSLEGQRNENLGAENTFNAATGDYGANYALSPVINAPNLTNFDTGISKLSAGQVPSWAPNYGGLSTMQANKDTSDPYAYLKR